MNRRDLLRIGGGFLMSSTVNRDALTEPQFLPPEVEGRTDLWVPENMVKLERFVGRGKWANHSGPSLRDEPPGVHSLHDLFVMSPKHFRHRHTIDLLDTFVCDDLGLNWLSTDWHRQRQALGLIVGQVAGTSDYDFGSFCLCSVWPGGQFRKALEDSRLEVSRWIEYPPEFLPANSTEIELGEFGMFPVKGILWGHPSEEDPEKINKLPIAKITVHRLLWSPLQHSHLEYIYCRADPTEDLACLRAIRSPGEMAIDKDRTDGVRMTALLGLHKAKHLSDLKADAYYSSLDIELDPRTGRTLSLRAAKASIAALLVRMPVEQRALFAAIQGESAPR